MIENTTSDSVEAMAHIRLWQRLDEAQVTQDTPHYGSALQLSAIQMDVELSLLRTPFMQEYLKPDWADQVCRRHWQSMKGRTFSEVINDQSISSLRGKLSLAAATKGASLG